MAVPKRRTSKARKHSRKANWKVSLPGIVECPQCMKQSSHIEFASIAAIMTASRSLTLTDNFMLQNYPVVLMRGRDFCV